MRKLFSIFILVIIFSCNSNERKKPDNVPQKAIWKGGVDGGCWVLFESVTDDTIEAIIFYQDGQFWKKGLFRKIGDCNFETVNIINEISGFDGESLTTEKGCVFKV